MSANMDVILRTTIPVELQGRVYACRNTLQFFTIPIGLFLGGFMVDNVCEPFMRMYGDLPVLKTLFGTGKGSGAAIMMLIPCLIKDTFKSALCSSITIADRKESSRFSTVAFDGMMYVTERMFETGFPILLEGNFVPGGVKAMDEAAVLYSLLHRYGYESLTFQFRGDTRVLHRRFVEREKIPERGQANKIGTAVSYEDFDCWCHNMDAFDVGGEVVRVDTTDFTKVDFDGLAETAGRFLEIG